MNNAMDLDDLENMSKNDFLPLIPLIKEELMDTPDDDTRPTGNPCDSADKQTQFSCDVLPTKCVFCNHYMSTNYRPKLLECLHAACEQCVNAKFSELDRTLPPLIHCPACNRASQNEFIIENQFVENAIEDTNNSSDSDNKSGAPATPVKCSSCSDDANATSWCVDCTEYICDNCVQAHQRLKITKDHTIKPKDEANCDAPMGGIINDKTPMCDIHTQEKLSLFCETCGKLTCRDCQLADHRDHKYKFAHEAAIETRETLSALCKEIDYKRFLLTSALKVIDDRQVMVTAKKQELIKEITAMVVQITNVVNMRGKQLAMRVNEVCDSKSKVLIEKRDALQQLWENVDHCIAFVQTAISKGNDCAILYSRKSLGRHLQKLKCQRADIPNPEIPVRIQVQLNQVNELKKVIAQLGQVVVDGKPFPALQNAVGQGPPRQQSSPNMAPPLRPGGLSQMTSQISPGGMASGGMPQSGPSGFNQNGPPMYNNSTSQQSYNNMPVNRQFNQEPSVRFSGIGPVMQRPGQPHVSSSTHPQNIDASLRAILNNHKQTATHGHLPFNGPPSYPGNVPNNVPVNVPVNVPPAAHQNMPQVVRTHFMSGPPGQQHQSFPQNQPGGPNNNYLPRFQNFQRMNNHTQNMGGGAQISSPGAMQRPPMHQNQISNNMGYTGSPSHDRFNGGPGPQASPQMTSMNMPSMAQWHIPQSAQQTNACTAQGSLMQCPNGRQRENFKISLKSPNTLKNTTPDGQIQGSPTVLPNVSSTNPKTPSPSTNNGPKDFTEPIDKVRDDSINDLMATIAKLDSNGVQVLPEGRTKTTSPQVHSSTDLSNTQEDKSDQKDDPNEDWCAVCLDGGELMCCDKCPKVFHQNCHIPTISSLPDESETWQCLLCVNLAELAANLEVNKRPGELNANELKIIQRICLELYCQYEQSLHFREPEPTTNSTYYEIICSPMTLDVVRTRLDPSSPNHYKDISLFISDIRLIFRNAFLFYQEDSKTYSHARYLRNFFEDQLAKWLPKYATEPRSYTNESNPDDRGHPAKRLRKHTE